MSGKKVLVVTYYWPPSGGAAVQRWLSFANKLAEKGWEVFVLTVDEKYATYQLYDESLAGNIHPSVKVYGTRTREPFKLYQSFFGKGSLPKPAFSDESNPSFTKKLARFIRGNFFIPDPRKGWKPFAVKKAMELIQEHGIGKVITAGPPHSTHFIGKKLKQIKGIRWIADFHDLWTDVIYYDMLYHLPMVKKADARLEKEIIESSDALITVGERYKQKLLEKSHHLHPEKISILRIGYDEAAFSGSLDPKTQDQFVITYTGSIADFYHPEVFIEALREIRDQFPQLPLLLRFVGVLSGGIREKIKKAGLQAILEETGYVSHQRSVKYLQESTVLLLVNPQVKNEAMVIPGKVYEYLAAKKPVINITTPDAETALLIESAGAGRTFGRNMKEELVSWLEMLARDWLVKRNLDLSHSGAEAYARGAITLQLETLLLQKDAKSDN